MLYVWSICTIVDVPDLTPKWVPPKTERKPLGCVRRFDSGVGGKINKDMESVQYRDLSLMVPNPKNPRKWKNDSEIRNLAESIRKNPDFFEARPILLSDRTGVLMIIGGERRWEAARHLGLTQAPSYLFHNLTEEREDEIMNRDNVHSGVWDEAKLHNWDKAQLQSWGVGVPKWKGAKPEVKEDNFDEKKAAKAKKRCKFGDLWKLGNHRLLCGDSTKAADVELLIGGGVIDLLLTDPPYGMFLDTDFSSCPGSLGSLGRKHGTRGNKYDKVIGDNEDFCPALIENCFMRNYKECFLFGADYFAELLPDKNNGSWLVWDKRKPNQADAIGSEFELIWSQRKHKRRMLRHDWFGFLSSENAKDAKHRVHPTQKPVSLLADILIQWGGESTTILDLYGGSGSTMIACEQLGKDCYMMELDEHYCDVIIARWETLTGQKAEKIN